MKKRVLIVIKPLKLFNSRSQVGSGYLVPIIKYQIYKFISNLKVISKLYIYIYQMINSTPIYACHLRLIDE